MWLLTARKAGSDTLHGEPGCTKHYEGTWQTRRQGTLKECYEEMDRSGTTFDVYRLDWRP